MCQFAAVAELAHASLEKPANGVCLLNRWGCLGKVVQLPATIAKLAITSQEVAAWYSVWHSLPLEIAVRPCFG